MVNLIELVVSIPFSLQMKNSGDIVTAVPLGPPKIIYGFSDQMDVELDKLAPTGAEFYAISEENGISLPSARIVRAVQFYKS